MEPDENQKKEINKELARRERIQLVAVELLEVLEEINNRYANLMSYKMRAKMKAVIAKTKPHEKVAPDQRPQV